MLKYQLFVTTKQFPNYYRPKGFYPTIEEVFNNFEDYRYDEFFVTTKNFRSWILLDTSTFNIVARGHITYDR